MREGATPTLGNPTQQAVPAPIRPSDDRLQVGMTLLYLRKDQFLEAGGIKTGELRPYKVVIDFDQFLASTPPRSVVLNCLSFFYTHGNDASVVHKIAC